MTELFLQIHDNSFWPVAAKGAFPIARQAAELQQEKQKKIHGDKVCKLEPMTSNMHDA